MGLDPRTDAHTRGATPEPGGSGAWPHASRESDRKLAPYVAFSDHAQPNRRRIFISRRCTNRRRIVRHDARGICNHQWMPNLVNLDRVAHRNFRVVEEQAFSVCKDLTMCPVSLNEIMRLVIEYPIVFTKTAED